MKYILSSNQPSNHNLHHGQAVNFPPKSLNQLSTFKELHQGRGWQQNKCFSGGTNKQRTVCDHSSAWCVASTTESSHPVSLNMVHWDLVILCKADPGNLCQCFVCMCLDGWLTPSPHLNRTALARQEILPSSPVAFLS